MNVRQSIVAALKKLLPQQIKRSLVHLAYHVEPDDFSEFAHIYNIAPSMRAGLQLLAKRGFYPRAIVDVGAYNGGWTTLARKVWPAARNIMIEANRAKIARLKTIGEAHCALLGATDGHTVTFNVMESGSSVLPELSDVPREVETRFVSTLDSLNLKIESPAFLKIDAQGYELEILKGASKSLPLIGAILLEIAMVEMNEGAPLFREVLAFMDQAGFVPSEILETHRRATDFALTQIDMIFLRKGAT